MNHQYKMDSLKLYAKTMPIWRSTNHGKIFSDDIGTQFGREKCAKVRFDEYLIVKSSKITVDMKIGIHEWEHYIAYKYLGIKWRERYQSSNKLKIIEIELFWRLTTKCYSC